MEKFSHYLSVIPAGDYYFLVQGRSTKQLLIPRRIFNNIRRNLNRRPVPKIDLEEVTFNDPELYEFLLRKFEMIIDKGVNEEERLRERFFQENPFVNQVALVLTMRCNFACPYCFEVEKKIDMSREVIDAGLEWFFRRAAGQPWVQVQLYGGEPLLLPDKVEYVVKRVKDYSRKSGIEHNFRLYTNGALFGRRYLKIFSKDNLESILLPIDGTKEIHDKRRFFKSGAPSYDIIMKNLPIMSEACQTLEIGIVVDRENYKSYPRLFKELKRLAIPNIVLRIGPTRESFGRGKDRGRALGRNGAKIVERLEAEADRLNLRRFTGDPPQLVPRIHHCMASAVNPVFIGPEGEVYTCIELVGEKENAVGSIFKGIDPLKRKEWEKHNVLNIPKCRRCKYIFICGGECPADLKYGHSSLSRCKAGFKKYFKTRLKNINEIKEEYFAWTAWEFADILENNRVR